jgi:hypothetical protein
VDKKQKKQQEEKKVAAPAAEESEEQIDASILVQEAEAVIKAANLPVPIPVIAAYDFLAMEFAKGNTFTLSLSCQD